MNVLKYICLILCLVWVFPINSAQSLFIFVGSNNYEHAPPLANPDYNAVVLSANLVQSLYSAVYIENVGLQNMSLHGSPNKFSRSAEVLVTAGKVAELEQEKRRMNPGEEFRDCADCPLMVVVPGGTFTMGSPDNEEGRYSDEGPQHRVTISGYFAVSKFEVTINEWQACVNEDSCWEYGSNDSSSGRGSYPATNLSWENAKDYVGWLNSKTGHQYRLLSEAEWEYVARAGTTTPFHFGSTISTEQANYNGNYVYGNGREGLWHKQTLPVGSFPPNSFGVHDMHGNVWEWVEDCWHNWYYGAPEDGSAWTESGYCDSRVIRGGSWLNEPWALRSAIRGRTSYGTLSDSIGFRISRPLTP